MLMVMKLYHDDIPVDISAKAAIDPIDILIALCACARNQLPENDGLRWNVGQWMIFRRMPLFLEIESLRYLALLSSIPRNQR